MAFPLTEVPHHAGGAESGDERNVTWRKNGEAYW